MNENSKNWSGWIGYTGLWSLAGVLAVMAHAGFIFWIIMPQQSEPIVEELAQSAIMIELAAEPEAIETDEQEIAPDERSAEAVNVSKPVVSEVTKEIAPEEIIEPVQDSEQADRSKPDLAEPVEQTVLEQEPLEHAEAVKLAKVETIDPTPVEPVEAEILEPVEDEIVEEADKLTIPVPTMRPQRLVKQKKKAKRQAKPKPRKASAPVRAAIKAKARARKSNRNAASQNSRGVRRSNLTPAKWRSRLFAHLARHKRNPSGLRRRGGETAQIRFRIDRQGNVKATKLVRSSGNPKLDNAALATVRRASPVPPPPPGVKLTQTVAIRFDRR
ncbi:MAG: hypothetical protein COB78_12085 [Hyphomicrobiales bacterium]|nr:MAG: hypothetical protein COB78_12085 [Hyphomicrobiales bacterium]